jgi:hypothetical protein
MVQSKAGHRIKLESMADGRLLPMDARAQGETLAGSRWGRRLSWGQPPAKQRRRGGAAHWGELVGGRDDQIWLPGSRPRDHGRELASVLSGFNGLTSLGQGRGRVR